MNYYLLFFAVYGALIAPVTFRFSLRLGERAGYGFRFQILSMPLMRMRKYDDAEGERPIREREVTRALAGSDTALIKALASPALRRRLAGSVELRSLTLHARFSFGDARKTALWYALTRELWRALMLCMPRRSRLEGHLEADFDGRGTEVLMRGIITARLGSISYTALVLGALYLSERAALKAAEEEKHAAAPD